MSLRGLYFGPKQSPKCISGGRQLPYSTTLRAVASHAVTPYNFFKYLCSIHKSKSTKISQPTVIAKERSDCSPTKLGRNLIFARVETATPPKNGGSQ